MKKPPSQALTSRQGPFFRNFQSYYIIVFELFYDNQKHKINFDFLVVVASMSEKGSNNNEEPEKPEEEIKEEKEVSEEEEEKEITEEEEKEKVPRKKLRPPREVSEETKFLKDFLDKYMGLSGEEAEVYLALLYFGSLTPGEIELYTYFSYDKVLKLLETLVGKGVIKEIPGVVKRYRVLPPFLGIYHFLEESGKKMEEISKTLSEELTNRINALKEQAKNDEKAFIDGLRSLRDDFQREIDQNKEAMNTQTEEFIKQMTNTISELLNALQNNINTLKTETEAFIDQTIANTETQLKTEKEQLDQKMNALSSKLEDFESGTRAKSQEIISKYESNLKSEIDTIAQFLHESNNKLSENTLNLLDAHKNRVSELTKKLTTSTTAKVTEQRDLLFEKMDELRLKFEGIMANDKEQHNVALTKLGNSALLSYEQMINKNREELQKLDNNILSTVETQSKRFNELLSSFDTQVLNEIMVSKQAAEKRMDDIRKEIEKVKTDQQKKVKGQISSIQNRVEKQFKSVENEISSISGTQQESLLNIVSSVSDKYSAYSDDVEKTVTKALDDALLSIKSAFDNIKMAIVKKVQANQQQISAFTADSTNLIKEINTKTNSLVSNTINVLHDEINKMIDLDQQRVNSLINLYSERLSTLGNSIYNTAFQSLLKLGNSTKSKVVDIKKKTNDTIEKWNDDFSKFVSQYNEQISKNYQETRAKINELVMEDIDRHSESIFKLTGSLDALFDTSKTEMTQTFSSFAETINNELSTNLTNLINDQNNLGNEIKNSTDQANQTIAQFAEKEKQQVSSVMGSLSNDLSDYFELVKSNFNSFTNETTTSLKEYGEAVDRSLKEVMESSKRHFDEIYNTVFDENKTWLDSSKMKMESDYKQFQTNFLEMLSSHSNQLSDAIEKFADKTVGQLVSLVNNASDQVLEAGKSVTDVVDEMKIKIETTNEFLDKAWENATNVPSTIAEKTWHIVGKEAVLNRIVDMIRRTKSMITIIVPTINDIPVDEIEIAKKTKKIHVLVDTAGNRDHEVIKKLVALPNVRVWHRPARDYYACTRDGEEVLMAPAIGSTREIVALVSEKEEYVILMHKFVGPMWMASSEEIK